MKIGDLIRQLQDVQKVHGDIDVFARDEEGSRVPANVEEGRHPEPANNAPVPVVMVQG